MATKVTTIGTAVLTTAAAGAALYYMYLRSVRRAITEKIVDEIVSILDSTECHVRDIALLRGKIRVLVEGGAQKLQIVTDFDRTLTKAFVNGQRGHASYGVVEDSSYITEEAVVKLNSLRDKYFPIEMSPTLSEAEKLPHMIEWYTTAINIAATANLQKRLLPAMVREGRAVLRDGCDQFFRIINEKKIPIFVISAGIGDIVDEVLLQQSSVPPQLKVVANYYSYNENGVVDGIKGDLIHTFNKKEVSVYNKDYFNSIKNHSNIILMGDTFGDPAMSDGIENVSTIIKIGFLNSNVEESLSQYLSVFDIVLTNDATMDIINVFLQKLVLEQ